MNVIEADPIKGVHPPDSPLWWKPFAERPPEENRHRAMRCREIAGEASSENMRTAFLLLAENYEGFANRPKFSLPVPPEAPVSA